MSDPTLLLGAAVGCVRHRVGADVILLFAIVLLVVQPLECRVHFAVLSTI
jgi:hypothetical protein